MASGDRKPYLTATVLDQDLLDACSDNLANQLEMAVDIQRPDGGFIYASDRNKYVGDTFYEALLEFPVIKRTVGEFLSNNLEFSQLTLDISNVDGRFNDILPSGANFDGWIGRSVEVKIGLRDVGSTYTTIFKGFVTDEGGFSRSTSAITLVARDQFDSVNQAFPTVAFTESSFPDIQESLVNLPVPVIYGDWTTNVEPNMASVPATVVNGADTDVNGEVSFTTNVSLVISDHDNQSFDTSEVYLLRGDLIFLMDAADITSVVGNRTFQIVQNGTTSIDGGAYEYEQGDRFYVKVEGIDLGTYSDNAVEIARNILINHGGLSVGDFDANWDTYRDKTTPTESAINSIKARVWIQDPQTAMDFANSLLEQVRLEAFVDRNLKFKLSSLHLDDFPAPGNIDFLLKNWDVEQGSFVPRLDDKNNFNRAKGTFNFLPNRDENFQETAIFKNTAAITQTGKAISKQIVFPNLYVESTVVDQVQEILRITSGYIENVDVNLTWRALLLDIGDFVKINVQIQGTIFNDVPALIRDIGYDPQGIKIPVRLWSLQMIPYSGHSPGFAGITGGTTATLTEE